jgi:cytochrome c biogenesis protein CcmG/thiol:disulfide interchange protein DsbE
MPTSRAASNRTSVLVPVAVLVCAGVFGLVALPRLAPDPLVGRPAPDFHLPRLARQAQAATPARLRLSELEGRSVILDFWASWCAPCRAQAPIIDRVVRAHAARGLVAVGIVSGDEPEDAARFLREHPVGYESVLDDQGDVSRAFRVGGLPTLVAIDRKGAIVAVRQGLVSEKELIGIVEAALAP